MNAKQIVSALGVGLMLSASAAVFADDNGGRSSQDAAVGSLTTGSVQVRTCRAAINSNGTIAGGQAVASATYLGANAYEVIFKAPCTNITSAQGWTHWVQVHTLQINSIPAGTTCTLADRAGNANGVFVLCTAPTSFFLSVEKP